jgi:hypothetical protein
MPKTTRKPQPDEAGLSRKSRKGVEPGPAEQDAW